MYKCEHFNIKELVSPDTYHARGEKSWHLIDTNLLWTIDRLRARYGSMTINDWSWGGQREWSGLRIPDSPYYSTYSMHTHGKAVDILFSNVTAEQVRQDILSNPNDKIFQYINSVELGTSWLHIDVRNAVRIYAFRP